MATKKQVNYALLLLGTQGYSTTHMNSEFKQLGARMRERAGTVEGWLSNMDVSRASLLIQELKKDAARTVLGSAKRAAWRVAACAVGPQLAKRAPPRAHR